MRLLKVDQRTPEWHSWRKTKITASMAPVIMGVSKWQTPYELFMEIAGLKQPRPPNFAMMQGIQVEEQVLEMFNHVINKSGSNPCNFVPCVVESSEIDYIGASLDGWCEECQMLVEIKNANEKDHELARLEIVPTHYIPQVQFQLVVTGTHQGYYCSHRNGEIIIVPVYQDGEYILDMMQKVNEFKTCLDTGVFPDMGEKDILNMEDDEEWKHLCTKYFVTKSQCNFWMDEMDKLTNELEKKCDGKNAEGHGVRLKKIVRRGTIDYSKISELKDIDVEQYRRPDTIYYKISDI